MKVKLIGLLIVVVFLVIHAQADGKDLFANRADGEVRFADLHSTNQALKSDLIDRGRLDDAALGKGRLALASHAGNSIRKSPRLQLRSLARDPGGSACQLHFGRDAVPKLALSGRGKHVERLAQASASGTDDPSGITKLKSCSGAAKVASRIMGFAAALLITFSSLGDGPGAVAHAAFSVPERNLPRTPDIALRRAIPSVSPELLQVRSKVEEVGRALRIPQRKPWAEMRKNIDESRKLLEDNPMKFLEPVLERDRVEAQSQLDELNSQLQKLSDTIDLQDPERTANRVFNSLELVANIQVFEMPELPYKLPKSYATLPRLTGRATAEALIERPQASGVFKTGQGGVEESSKLTFKLVMDGYNAPITAGRFVQSIQKGVFKNVVLNKGPVAVYATGDGSNSAPPLPLEFKPLGRGEPQYKYSLDVSSGEELPTLPMSVPGSLAMSRGTDTGTSDPNAFFFYLFDRGTAGLGGLSFDEGEFSVFGYVVEGFDLLDKLQSGDILRSITLTSGAERLFIPPS